MRYQRWVKPGGAVRLAGSEPSLSMSSAAAGRGFTGMTGAGRHLVLYDGVCGLCDRLVQGVLARDQEEVFDFASLQSSAAKTALMRYGRNPGALDTFYVVADYQTATPRLLDKSRAALMVGSSLGWPWKAVAAFGRTAARASRLGLRRGRALPLSRLWTVRPLLLVRPEHRPASSILPSRIPSGSPLALRHQVR